MRSSDGQKLGYKISEEVWRSSDLVDCKKKVFLIIFLVEHLYACKLKASREIGCMCYKK